MEYITSILYFLAFYNLSRSYWKYTIYNWFTYSKMVIFYSYVSLPEGNTSWYLDIYLDYDHWNYYKVIIVITILTNMTMLSILLCITFITIKTKCDSYSYCNYCPKTISTYYHSCYPWMITIVPILITRTTTITKLVSTLTCCYYVTIHITQVLVR